MQKQRNGRYNIRSECLTPNCLHTQLSTTLTILNLKIKQAHAIQNLKVLTLLVVFALSEEFSCFTKR